MAELSMCVFILGQESSSRETVANADAALAISCP